MSSASQFFGGSVPLGSYQLFSGNLPNQITLPDGKVLLKSGVLAPASTFPTVPATFTDDLNPLVPVSQIGSGAIWRQVIIDPNTGFPVIVGSGQGGFVVELPNLADPTQDNRLYDGTAGVLSNQGPGPVVTASVVHKGYMGFAHDGTLSAYAATVAYWSFMDASGNYTLGNVGNAPANGGVRAFASNPAGNVVAVLNISHGSAYYAAGLNSNPTATDLPAAAQWTGVAWSAGSGLFVAVASGGTQAASSPDGVTWTSRTLPASAAWACAAAATSGNLFVAIAGGGSTQAASSVDGINWTSRTMPVSADWSAVKHNGSMFVAAAKDSNIAATSTDGITWTQRTLPATADWQDVTWCPAFSAWVACASDGRAALATSSDGITWTARAIGVRCLDFTAVFAGGGSTLYGLANYASQPVIAKSADSGATWRYYVPNIQVGWSSSACEHINFVNGQFVGLSAFGTADTAKVWTSSDGITWAVNNRTFTSDPGGFQAIAHNGTNYVACAANINDTTASAQNNTLVWSSPDLVTWTQRACNTGITTSSWSLVAAGTTFVAVAGSSSFPRYKAFQSTDNGVTWTLTLDPGNGLAGSDLIYDSLRDVVLWTSTTQANGAYLSNNKGANWAWNGKMTASGMYHNNYELGLIFGGSNGSWCSYTTAGVTVWPGKWGGIAKKAYAHGYSLKNNRTNGSSAFGITPVDQGGTRYFHNGMTLLKVDTASGKYIDNTKVGVEYTTNNTIPGLSYYMRVK